MTMKMLLHCQWRIKLLYFVIGALMFQPWQHKSKLTGLQAAGQYLDDADVDLCLLISTTLHDQLTGHSTSPQQCVCVLDAVQWLAAPDALGGMVKIAQWQVK
jgi:hypothetical protein